MINILGIHLNATHGYMTQRQEHFRILLENSGDIPIYGFIVMEDGNYILQEESTHGK